MPWEMVVHKDSEKEPATVAAGALYHVRTTEAASYLDADPGPEIPTCRSGRMEPLPVLKTGARTLFGADVGGAVR